MLKGQDEGGTELLVEESIDHPTIHSHLFLISAQPSPSPGGSYVLLQSDVIAVPERFPPTGASSAAACYQGIRSMHSLAVSALNQ